VRALEVGEFAVFGGVVGKVVVRESGAGDDVGSHGKASRVGCEALVYAEWVARGVVVMEQERRCVRTPKSEDPGSKNEPGAPAEIEERFLAAQADTFAGSEREGKSVGLLRSK